MSDCNTCVHKRDGCYCPPDKTCTVYKKEKVYVRHTFEFKTSEDWRPGESACWCECPFSINIRLGEMCKFKCESYGKECPFLTSMAR